MLKYLKGKFSKFSSANIEFVSGADRLDRDKLDKAIENADIIIQYKPEGFALGKKDTLELAHYLPSKNKILIYEEAYSTHGGGGGWELPPFQEILYLSLVFTITNPAAGFLQEAGKDLYKKLSNKVGTMIRESKDKQSLAVRINIPGKKELVYIMQESLSADEAIEAFQKIEDHSKMKADELSNTVGLFRFFYDKHDKKWVSFD